MKSVIMKKFYVFVHSLEDKFKTFLIIFKKDKTKDEHSDVLFSIWEDRRKLAKGRWCEKTINGL